MNLPSSAGTFKLFKFFRPQIKKGPENSALAMLKRANNKGNKLILSIFNNQNKLFIANFPRIIRYNLPDQI